MLCRGILAKPGGEINFIHFVETSLLPEEAYVYCIFPHDRRMKK